MNKLREAARQVVANGVQGTYAKYYSVPPADFESLREALAEQAEQEPVACERCEELAADKGTWYRMADRFAHRNEELKKALAQALNLIEGEWPKGDEIAQPVIDAMKATLANQPAPVRTKDLADDELASACGWKLGDPMYEWVVDIGRLAIAADREKNK